MGVRVWLLKSEELRQCRHGKYSGLRLGEGRMESQAVIYGCLVGSERITDTRNSIISFKNLRKWCCKKIPFLNREHRIKSKMIKQLPCNESSISIKAKSPLVDEVSNDRSRDSAYFSVSNISESLDDEI